MIINERPVNLSNAIQRDIIKIITKNGLSTITPEYYLQILLWQEWYRGAVRDFHFYNVRIADGTTVVKEKLTMNCAKKVSEDMQKLLWSNKVQINLDTPKKTRALWEILEANNFDVMMPRQLELCAAGGTVLFSEFLRDSNVVIEYVGDSTKIIPYQYTNNKITGLVTFNRFTRIERNKPVYFTHLVFHEFVNKIYTKYNELYVSKSSDELGKEVEFNSIYPDVQQVTIYTNVEYPHFQVLKFPITNNYDLENPMGISIYANSIDRFKALDTKYDSFNNEFISGRKRILVDASALKGVPQVDSDGNITTNIYFDRNDTTFQALRGMDNQPIKDIDFNLRYQEHIDSIQSELNWLSSNVGFGENFYSFSGTQPMTATEVLSRDSDAYRTKDSYETCLCECVEGLVRVVCYLSNIKSETIEVVTDYSRFKNDSAEQTRLLQEVNNGITSKVEYRMKVYNEEEKVARQKIDDIRVNEPTVDQLVGV